MSGEEDTLEHFDYKGFRHVEVIVPDGVTVLSDFTAVVRHFPFNDDAFTYRSSDALVDRVLEICKNGVKYGTQEVFVDCPTREKGQYLGDFTVTGHAHLLLTGQTEKYKQTLRDFAASTAICPGMMAVAPGGYMQEIADFSMQWPLQLYQYYRYTGDKTFLFEMKDILAGLEDYFAKYQREDGLLVNVDEKWNLVDWPDNLRDGYDFELTRPIGQGCHNVINAHYYGMLCYIEKIRGVLGVPVKNDLEKLKASFIDTFYDNDKGLFVDCEGSQHTSIHANALPLFYDIYPAESRQKAVALIVDRAHNCGVQFSYFVLKALAKADAHEKVYELIGDLWSTMVEEGATTCFEAWGKDQKFNTSLCHPWASAPIPVMVEDIIGLNPTLAGWKHLSFMPHIPQTLDAFHLTLPTPYGQITVRKDQFGVTIDVPEAISLLRPEE